MSRKIIGVTVGTPLSPARIEVELKPVKTVNGITPDENGNVELVGNIGADGKSAYQIALDNGFKGTEKEWLDSLNGEKGADGYTPIKGTDYFTEADKAEMIEAVLAEIPNGDDEDNTEGGYDADTGLWGNWDISKIKEYGSNTGFGRFKFYGYVDGVYIDGRTAFISGPGDATISIDGEIGIIYQNQYGTEIINRLTNNTIGFGTTPQHLETYQGEYYPDPNATQWFVSFATPIKADHFTEDEKAEMVAAVLEALPEWTGGSY